MKNLRAYKYIYNTMSYIIQTSNRDYHLDAIALRFSLLLFLLRPLFAPHWDLFYFFLQEAPSCGTLGDVTHCTDTLLSKEIKTQYNAKLQETLISALIV